MSKELALENFKSGMNCCQSVVCAYSKDVGIDSTTAFKIAEGFGGGMGMGCVCGALSGVFILFGLINSSGTIKNITKAQTIKLVQSAWKEFETLNGSSMCEVLKGNTGKPTVSCIKCIEDACSIFEKIKSEYKKTV